MESEVEIMNQEQLKRMAAGKGFIAALDQSGGSTPKALKQYGINEDRYSNDEQMYNLVHQMRTRIIKSPAFNSEHILAAILFENTMNRTVDGDFTGDYLWNKKGIVPFLKVDKGLEEAKEGVKLMKPIPGLDALLKQAVERNIFGTKMRSFISEYNPAGIKQIVAQQFEIGKQIFAAGLVPILEPEADIYSASREESETALKNEIKAQLKQLDNSVKIMLKLSIPVKDNFYADLMDDPRIVRIVALSGGYSRDEANQKLARNKDLIASFSRALAEGLSDGQTDGGFNAVLEKSVESIYQASIT